MLQIRRERKSRFANRTRASVEERNLIGCSLIVGSSDLGIQRWTASSDRRLRVTLGAALRIEARPEAVFHRINLRKFNKSRGKVRPLILCQARNESAGSGLTGANSGVVRAGLRCGLLN
jgi:hypothetical protein